MTRLASRSDPISVSNVIFSLFLLRNVLVTASAKDFNLENYALLIRTLPIMQPIFSIHSQLNILRVLMEVFKRKIICLTGYTIQLIIFILVLR